jgi:FdhE protein
LQRVLQPGQIEALAQRSIPRVRLPDRNNVFSSRAARLRELAAGHAIGDYLRLMAVLVDAQHAALLGLAATPMFSPDSAQLAAARAHGMPLLHAAGQRRDSGWRNLLIRLCDHVTKIGNFPDRVGAVIAQIRRTPDERIEALADALLTSAHADVDAAKAPFVMAALQIGWVDAASRFALDDVQPLDVPGVCPVCGTLPVASIIHTEQPYQGYRFLHCALCATEWHMVRVTCTQCQATAGIHYHSIEGGSNEGEGGSIKGGPIKGAVESVRAESCESCHTYRKVLYREKDPKVDPVADDLATVTLDLLMTEAGYHRGSGNPLLWQNPEV